MNVMNPIPAGSCWPVKLRSPCKIHGGKAYLARRIIERMPRHTAYVEPFGGMASVLLNKARSDVEVYNDRDPGKVAVMLAIRDRVDDFIEALQAIPYSLASFEAARSADPRDDFERAVAFFVRSRMSRGGLATAFSWSDRLRGGQAESLNAWETILSQLPAIAERLQGVRILNENAFDVIADAGDALLFVDPPYLSETRTARKAYGRFELSDDDHARLADLLNRHAGPVMLSGYPSEAYAEWFAGWTRHDFKIANHAGQGKTKARRIESLWVRP
jgi:DNA adenine methylase